MLTRVQYRRQVGLGGKKMEVAKHAVFKNELRSAKDAENPHPQFGFTCLHYSVSEASGSIRINVKNKLDTAGRVRVCTIDQEAKAGDDYEKVDEILEFTGQEKDGLKYITVTINDDDNWEPDEDFWVQLYEPVDGPIENAPLLKGGDTKTIVTIIDDDKPGSIAFEDSKPIKAVASSGKAEIKIVRKNGSDGKVTVDYETV